MIQTDRGCVIHFKKFRVHVPMTDHTNTKGLIIDFFQAGLDHMEMSLNTMIIVAKTKILFRLRCDFQKFCDFLLLFYQPLLNASVEFSNHQTSKPGSTAYSIGQ